MHKEANQVESRCSGLRSHGKLERHAAWHYLVEMSDCTAAQTEPCTEWHLSFR